MPFQPQPPINRTPTRIRRLEIRMFKSVDENDPEYPQGIEYRFTVDDQFDQAMNHFHGDLIPHISEEVTPIDIPAGTPWLMVLEGFYDIMWTKAETEVLP